MSLGFWGKDSDHLIQSTKCLYESHSSVSHFADDLHSYHSPICFHIKMSVFPKHSTLALWNDVLSTCVLQLCV